MPLWLTQRQLKSKNTALRQKAVQQLCDQPNPRAIGILRQALSDEDVEVRRLAATALGKLEIEGRFEPLLGALRDSDPEVQKAAIQGLKRMQGNKAAGSLIALLRSGDADVRGHAADALQLQGWQPGTPDDEIWFWTAKSQFSRVAAMGPKAIPALETVLKSSYYSVSVAAIQALGQIGDLRGSRALVSALRSPDAAVCLAAVDALSKLGGPEAPSALVGMLRHKNAQVRLAAVEGLSALHAEGVTAPLRELLNDPVWDVRRTVAEALGKLKDPEAVAALTRTLNDGDADVREASALSLGRLTDRRAIGPLVLALRDSASGVRRIAAAALSRIDEDWSSSPEARAALEGLKPALDDRDPEVRNFVGHVLRGLGHAEASSAEPSDPEMSVDARNPRRKLAVSLFLAILCDEDRDLRQAAAIALGRLGDTRAETGLVRAASDTDEGVRAAANEAIKAIGRDT